ncbi:unnamed protein product [Oppiella nova]|uniref:Uncharacterized protein n=1 Tax=Oppiella nova TaxID=334625 RepID=A0A7R9MLD4_9ACAR|nr:unnamed protein product [Oppiella nova]CAG2179123.1 unnamed protein product [Oppiella nova]
MIPIRRLDNPVPIGFIYVQLPDQKSPGEIWPGLQWENVSPSYGGLFFRAEGGDSVGFGSEQGYSAPRIERAYAETYPFSTVPTIDVIFPASGWTLPIMSAHNYNDSMNYETLKFLISGGEVRPVNKAVRIWKRTG